VRWLGIVCALGASAPALAQAPALEADLHGPALPPLAPDAPLTVWAPGSLATGQWTASTSVEIANGLLYGAAGDTRFAALTQLVGIQLAGRWQPTRALGLGLTAPIWLHSREASAPDAAVHRGPALGDLWLWAPIALWRPDGTTGFGLDVLPALGLPTGATARLVGAPTARPALRLVPGYAGDHLAASGEVGLGWVGGTTDNVRGLSAWGAGAARWRFDAWSIGGELRASQPLRRVDVPDSGGLSGAAAVEASVVVGGRWGARGWTAASVGRGLTSGPGAPDARLVVAAGIGPARAEASAPTPVVKDAPGTLLVRDPDGRPLSGASVRAGPALLGATDAAGTLSVAWTRDLARAALDITAPGAIPAQATFDDARHAEVTLRWAPVAIQVRWTDPTGQPLAGSWSAVRIDAASGDEVAGTGGIALTPGEWRVTFAAPGAAPQARDVWVQPGAADAIEVVQQPATGEARAHVRVVDADGAPVPSARLLLDGQPFGTTGRLGAVAIDGLTPGVHPLLARADGYTEAQVDITLATGDTDVVVRLDPLPGTVRVRVRGPDGRPVPDATVQFEGPARLPSAPLGPLGTRSQVLGPGDWTAIVASPTHGLQERPIQIAPDAQQPITVDVVLQPPEFGGAELVVRVVDDAGAPVDAAEVALDGRPLGTTSNEGLLRLTDLDPGPRALAIQAPLREPVIVAPLPLVAGIQEQLVALDWQVGATRVRANGATGAVRDATARFEGVAGGPAPLPLGEDGAADLLLPPGEWIVTVTSPTLGFQESEVAIRQEDRRLHEAALWLGGPPAGTSALTVTAVDPDGQPVDGALVSLDGTPAGVTGDRGRAALRGLDDGRHAVGVSAPPLHAPWRGEAVLGDAEAATTAALAWAGGTAAVQVRGPDGAPVPDAIARWSGPSSRPAVPLGPDGFGRFALDPGGWTLLVTSRTLGFAEAEVAIDPAVAMQPVAVALAAPTPGRAALLVRAIDPDGRPVRGAHLRAGEQRADTDAGGAALFTDLAPGEAELLAEATGFEPARLPIALGDRPQERIVRLDFSPRPLTVTVVDADGRPVDAELQLAGPAEISPRRVGEDGEAIVPVRPGRWTVVASTDTLGPTNAVATIGDAPASVRLQLAPRRVSSAADQLVLADSVPFDFGSAALGPNADPILRQVAAAVLERPDILRVEVQGHADDRGTVAFNQALSQARADAVAAALVSLGVPREQLHAVGYGTQRPVASNDTEAGRTANRRVAFVLTTVGASPPPSSSGELGRVKDE
jgi:outer membrane protein OmpA-like peptidoglycan-associated protein